MQNQDKSTCLTEFAKLVQLIQSFSPVDMKGKQKEEAEKNIEKTIKLIRYDIDKLE